MSFIKSFEKYIIISVVENFICDAWIAASDGEVTDSTIIGSLKMSSEAWSNLSKLLLLVFWVQLLSWHTPFRDLELTYTDMMINTKKEDRLVLAGLVNSVPMPSDGEAKKKWLHYLIAPLPLYTRQGSSRDPGVDRGYILT